MQENKKKNAFTLVELLAVLIILAVILVIAVPKVMSIISDVRKSTFESTAKLVASSAEKQKIENEIMGVDEVITCENIVKLSSADYERCYIQFIEDRAYIDIKGAGKYKEMYICKGTKNQASVVEKCLNEKVLVELEVYNGNIISNIYKEGNTIELETPVREDFVFLGWEIIKGDSVLEDKYKLLVGEKDTLIKARWQNNSLLTVKLNDEENNLMYNERFLSETILDLGIPTRENYQFIKWEVVEGNGIVSGTTFTMGTEKTVVEAIWEINKFELTVNKNGGTTQEFKEEYAVGEKVILEYPVKEGYTFNGWTVTGSGASVNENIFTMGTSDAILTANWEANAYIVNFDPNGGNAIGENISYTTSGQYTYKVTSTEEYQLEVWGAQGGGNGGYGSYSKGVINLTENETLFITVGGQGGRNEGGYNGGGDGQYLAGTVSPAAYGGGGATHIASVAGLLKDTDINNVYIIAGGGGGGSENNKVGGHAGGHTGNDGTGTCYVGTGGTQTAGGAAGDFDSSSGGYGYGGNAPTGKDKKGTYGAGGGGAGYYGGGGNSFKSESDCAGGGAGGSGFINNELLYNKYMYCYSCTPYENDDALTLPTNNVDDAPISNYAKTGNGAAKITKLVSKISIIYNNTYGTLIVPQRYGYKFVGWNTKIDGSGTYIEDNTTMITANNHTLYAIWQKT